MEGSFKGEGFSLQWLARSQFVETGQSPMITSLTDFDLFEH